MVLLFLSLLSVYFLIDKKTSEVIGRGNGPQPLNSIFLPILYVLEQSSSPQYIEAYKNIKYDSSPTPYIEFVGEPW